MQQYVTIETLIALGLGLVMGYALGFAVAFYFKKDKIDSVKFMSTVIFVTWVGLHIYGFFNAISVPLLFDIVGGVTVGNLLGFDLGEVFSKIKLKK